MSDLLTVDRIMSWEPCSNYPRERVAEIGGDGMTPSEMRDADISAEDRLWVLIHCLPEREQRLLACQFARHVLPIYEDAHPGDDRPRRCIETAERYAVGQATKDELAAAWAAARDAAWAAWAAARDAAWAASGTSRAAASAAAWAAARDASWAAAWDARDARDVERDWQLDRALETINREKGAS